MSLEYVTVSEAAKIKGVSRIAILNAIYYGRVKASRAGNMWLIKAEDLEKYVPRGKTGPRKAKRIPAEPRKVTVRRIE